MSYCGNNLARQPLQCRLCKLSVWKKFNFNSWMEIHGFFPQTLALIGLRAHHWIHNEWTKKSFSVFVSHLIQPKSRGIISRPPLNWEDSFSSSFFLLWDDLAQIDKLAIVWQLSYLWYYLFQFPQQAASGMFLLLYTFISFRPSPAGAVSHCLPLSPWLMFTGHSNTLNSLVRKGKMGALAGVRYCGGTEGAISMGRQRNLASVW